MCQRIDDPDFEDAAKLVVVIGDAVSTVVVGVPPVLVASIIVRMGLRISATVRSGATTMSNVFVGVVEGFELGSVAVGLMDRSSTHWPRPDSRTSAPTTRSRPR